MTLIKKKCTWSGTRQRYDTTTALVSLRKSSIDKKSNEGMFLLHKNALIWISTKRHDTTTALVSLRYRLDKK